MYDFIVDFIGELPTEFTFIYSIVTLLMSTLVITFLFNLFYIPIKLFKER